ncbi:MAG: NAD(P)-dependent alcohol dehydrogenase [Proteobacteria bacterium]|nr:MAG: NAD(P)-dependent alcohol dehydrogenase [Pseudomonadota bacterium]
MKAYQLATASPGTEAWQLRDLPKPNPGPGQVLVKIEAVSLNYRDLMVAKGTYGGKIRDGLIPLSDGAGTIAELGEGVTDWKIGDRVTSCFFATWAAGPIEARHQKQALGGTVDGVAAEYVALNAGAVMKIPAHLSFEEASTLPCAGLTAWHAIFETGLTLAPGSTLLTQGTGGVSTFALLFAKLAGLTVISTSSSDEKLKRMEALGADALINYKTHPAWDAEVWRLSSARGVDQVVEVGGAGTLPLSLKACAPNAKVSVIGVLSGATEGVNPAPILQRSLRVQGIYVGSAEMFGRMNRAIEANKLKPVIDEVIPFTEARSALLKMESGGHFGKIVLKL